MGDVLMTTPALRALKHGVRGRRLTLLTSAAGAGIARLVPEVDEVVVYTAPWVKFGGLPPDASGLESMICRVRNGGFDAAVIFTVYSQNPLPAAMMCFLADIPRRLAHCRENPYGLLTEWVPDPEPGNGVRHEVRRQLDLVASVGCTTRDQKLSLRVPGRARRRVRALLADMDRRRPWAVVHPGATASSRCYPPELYAAAARALVRDWGWQVVFTGSAGEAPLVDAIRAAMEAPARSLAGCLDLAELAALFAEAPLIVTNNTGPMHVAAAVGTPVVALYALTNPQHTPWDVASRVLSHDVPCRNCYKSVCPEGHHACLRAVRPEAVVAAALELAASRPARVAAASS
jgi:lipopolysaccharide heptosyltransferase II